MDWQLIASYFTVISTDIFNSVQRAPEKRIQRYFSLFLIESIYCDPSLEPSRRDGSNDGSQNVFTEEYG